MFEKVLIGVDGVEEACDAVAFALMLSPRAELTLVNVYPYDADPWSTTGLAWRGALEGEARRLVEEARAAAGAEASLRVVGDPSPAHALQVVAAEVGADLLVLGPSRHSAFGRIAAGSTVRSALAGAPCPVAVVPRGPSPLPLRMLAVAFDGSPEAWHALDTASRLAAEDHRRLRIVTVVHPPGAVVAPVYPYTYGPADWQRRGEEELAHARGLLERALADAPAGTEADVLVGRPGDELARISGLVDLMVVGSRGWGPVHQVLAGSTSRHVVGHARCPVLVVPRGADVPPAAQSSDVTVAQA